MAAPSVVQIPSLLQPFQRELADRFQHADARLAVGALGHRDQADIVQPRGQIQGFGPGLLGALAGPGRSDGGERVQVAAAGEHPQAAEHLRQVGGQ